MACCLFKVLRMPNVPWWKLYLLRPRWKNLLQKGLCQVSYSYLPMTSPKINFLQKKPIFLRLFGTKCDKCHRSFGKNDFVMRAKNKIFHLECFRCVACEKQLVPGDEFALRDDGLFCREDHQDNDRKDSILDNNNTIIHHNASNSSEDNSEGM